MLFLARQSLALLALQGSQSGCHCSVPELLVRQQGLAAKVVQELERRAVLAGYSHIYLTTGFRQPEAVKLYLSQGYEAQFDLTRDPEEYSQPPYDGRLRFTKALAVSAYSHSA